MDRNGFELQSGDLVQLQAYEGNYVMAVNGNCSWVTAVSAALGAYEAFHILKIGCTGLLTIGTGDTVALTMPDLLNPRYVGGENGGGSSRVYADRTALGPWWCSPHFERTGPYTGSCPYKCVDGEAGRG